MAYEGKGEDKVTKGWQPNKTEKYNAINNKNSFKLTQTAAID